MDNVCKFLPPPRTTHQLQAINFVHEKNPRAVPPCAHATVYRAHLVTAGTGRVRVGNIVAEVSAGDVFFTLPALPFEILADKEMRYLYVSYVGVRGAAETERAGVCAKRFVFKDMQDLEPFWMGALEMGDEVTDLAAESVLLYTLCAIATRTASSMQPPAFCGTSQNFALIKQYIDEHFCDPALCGDRIGMYFSYNKKYISTLFKRQMKVGISEYIRTLRLNRAAELLERGEMSIAEIARAVGFVDPLYFSRLFKAHTGRSPKQYAAKEP